MANKRITDVDFINSLDSNESFFVNQNNALKQISKENIVFGISQGGTGATTASGALANLGITATTTELNKLKGITATTSELNYVDGVTSNIQTQLNGKAESNHNHDISHITSGTLGIDKGGTGATDAATARANLGAQASLGFTPVQQGFADGTGNNKIRLGWKMTDDGKYAIGIEVDGTFVGHAVVDSNDFGTIIPISKGGTGSANGATGLNNLLASGVTVLSSYQFGEISAIPNSGTTGQVFFVKGG